MLLRSRHGASHYKHRNGDFKTEQMQEMVPVVLPLALEITFHLLKVQLLGHHDQSSAELYENHGDDHRI